MQGLPAIAVTSDSRELLPHVFTLTRHGFREGIDPIVEAIAGGYSLWHCLANQPENGLIVAGYSPVQCSVLSGLSSLLIRSAITRPVVPQR